MSWLEVALVIAVLVGAGCGAALVVRNPAFWMGLGKAAVTAALPEIIRVVTKRMSPEEERRYQECLRRAGTWDHRTKRCKL